MFKHCQLFAENQKLFNWWNALYSPSISVCSESRSLFCRTDLLKKDQDSNWTGMPGGIRYFEEGGDKEASASPTRFRNSFWCLD